MQQFDLRDKSVVVTGGAGFLGRVVCQKLEQRGAGTITVPRSADFDLTRQDAAYDLIAQHRPDLVIHLAAEVGGIGANRDNPGRYFYANMAMGLHLIEAAREIGVGKFVQIGTICAYPKFTPVPFREDDLWAGYPEETNAPYGVAKKALLVMLEAYRAQYGFPGVYLLPVNLYGPGDNFDLHSSHVIPALVRKFVTARDDGAPFVEAWGSGNASREFLYVDDCAEGILLASERYDSPAPVNLGTDSEITIRDLAEKIAAVVGYDGEIRWDASKPDGQPRRRLNTERAAAEFDFVAQTDLDEGLRRTVDWWQSTRAKAAV